MNIDYSRVAGLRDDENVFEMSDDESRSEMDSDSDGELFPSSESSTIPRLRTSRLGHGQNPSTARGPLRTDRLETFNSSCAQRQTPTTVAPINHSLEGYKNTFTTANPTHFLSEGADKSHTLHEDAYPSLTMRYPAGVTARIVNVVNGIYQPPFKQRMHLKTPEVLAAAETHCIATYGGKFMVKLKSIRCGKTEFAIGGYVPRLDQVADGMCEKGTVPMFQLVVECLRVV